MINRLLSALGNPSRNPAEPAFDGKLALAALLVRIARADNDYAADEIAAIDAVLSHRYGLSDAGAAEVRQRAEALEAAAPDTVRFTRALKDAVPYEDRTSVIESLWRVVLADGRRDDEEDGLMRLVASLLGINDRDSALARRRVQRENE